MTAFPCFSLLFPHPKKTGGDRRGLELLQAKGNWGIILHLQVHDHREKKVKTIRQVHPSFTQMKVTVQLRIGKENGIAVIEKYLQKNCKKNIPPAKGFFGPQNKCFKVERGRIMPQGFPKLGLQVHRDPVFAAAASFWFDGWRGHAALISWLL